MQVSVHGTGAERSAHRSVNRQLPPHAFQPWGPPLSRIKNGLFRTRDANQVYSLFFFMFFTVTVPFVYGNGFEKKQKWLGKRKKKNPSVTPTKARSLQTFPISAGCRHSTSLSWNKTRPVKPPAPPEPTSRRLAACSWLTISRLWKSLSLPNNRGDKCSPLSSELFLKSPFSAPGHSGAAISFCRFPAAVGKRAAAAGLPCGNRVCSHTAWGQETGMLPASVLKRSRASDIVQALEFQSNRDLSAATMSSNSESLECYKNRTCTWLCEWAHTVQTWAPLLLCSQLFRALFCWSTAARAMHHPWNPPEELLPVLQGLGAGWSSAGAALPCFALEERLSAT